MKILVFDIGGTAIKYGICQSGKLLSINECPTEAYKGGPHILQTICSLAEHSLPFDAIGISTAGQVNPQEGSIMLTAIFLIIPAHNSRKSCRNVFMFLLLQKMMLTVQHSERPFLVQEREIILFCALHMEPELEVLLLKMGKFIMVLLSQLESLVLLPLMQKKSLPVLTHLMDVTNATLLPLHLSKWFLPLIHRLPTDARFLRILNDQKLKLL